MLFILVLDTLPNNCLYAVANPFSEAYMSVYVNGDIAHHKIKTQSWGQEEADPI